MNITRITVTAAVVGILGAATSFAQTPSPPESTSNPSSASSPSQRDATRSPANEAPATSQPSDTSTPHQREAMGKPQTMKECMDTHAAKNSGMSKADMTKACDEQMKMQKKHLSKAPDSMPKSSDSYSTPAPK